MDTPCIEHNHPVNSSGYGSCRYMGHKVGRHVKAYLTHHNLPHAATQGKVVMHTCDNRICVNPEHLVLGTQSDNLRDMVNKGRQRLVVRFGEDNPFAKLTDAEVDYIRKNYVRGVNQTKRGNARLLAEQFGVSRPLIQKIGQGVLRVRGTLTTTT